MPELLLVLLAFGAAIEMIWISLQAPVVAANKLRFVGLVYTLVSSFALLALYVFAQSVGIVAYGWTALALSFVMLVVAFAENAGLRRLMKAVVQSSQA